MNTEYRIELYLLVLCQKINELHQFPSADNVGIVGLLVETTAAEEIGQVDSADHVTQGHHSEITGVKSLSVIISNHDQCRLVS